MGTEERSSRQIYLSVHNNNRNTRKRSKICSKYNSPKHHHYLYTRNLKIGSTQIH